MRLGSTAGYMETNRWMHDSLLGFQKEPTGRGGQTIVTYSGTSQGFVANLVNTFRPKAEGDYHQDMNSRVII